MTKKTLLILWIVFIVIVNLAFIAGFVIKSQTLAVILAVLSAAALIAAIVYNIKYSAALKKQAAARREYAKKAAAEWKPKEK